MPVTLKDRALGAYVGLAVGDALGATTEFMTPREIEVAYGVHDQICGGGWLKLKPGQVTDDTEMSLALGQAIIERGRVESQAVAEAFSNWMRSKPVDIGNTVRRGIIHYRSSGQSCVEVNEYDAGNGACMRSLPIALYCCHAPEETLREASRQQSHTTHNNPLADAGTESVLRMLVALLNGADKTHIRELADRLVMQYPEYRFDKRRAENPSGYIVHTLQAVFQALFGHDDYRSILIDVVNRGGDADTTGAIAGMLAGACYGLESIPAEWLRKMDKKVIDDCQQQTIQLLSMAEEQSGAA